MAIWENGELITADKLTRSGATRIYSEQGLEEFADLCTFEEGSIHYISASELCELLETQLVYISPNNNLYACWPIVDVSEDDNRYTFKSLSPTPGVYYSWVENGDKISRHTG